jgi:hypothetical protein
MARHRVDQGCEVLPLALATEDEHQPALRAKADEGSGRGAHVGALAVVEIFDVLNHPHGLDPVRLAPVFAQTEQHGGQAAACCPGQCQCRQGVQRIVTTADTQGIGGHQPLDVELLDVVLASAPRFVGLQSAHQPGHAIDHFDPVITGAMWHVATKGHHGALHRPLESRAHRRGSHGHHQRIVAVQDHQPLLAKDFVLRGSIGLHAPVPVEVILRQVQHCCGGGLEAAATVELETGQLQHPDVGQCVRIQTG